MQPYHWSIVGLVFDIFGAFLLSVEAIKIENLRRLRDRFLAPMHRHTISPRLAFDEGVEDTNIWSRHLGLFMGLHWIAGLVVFLALNRLTSGWPLATSVNVCLWFLSFSGWKFILMIILAVYCLVLLLFGLWTLGEAVHIVITFSTRCLVLFVEWIDRRTPSGGVGLLGFALLLAGFVFQMYGTYAGSGGFRH